MKIVLSVVSLLAITGCASPGVAEDFVWLVSCPKTVDRGAEFEFVVRSCTAASKPVNGVSYRFHILWPGGSANPLRHRGSTGEPIKLHARMSAGPATIVVTCPNRDGLDTTVLETTFEVK